MEGQKHCRKCLLRDMDWTEYFRNMREYIRSLPAEDKVSDEEYERRLAACRTCEWLLEGMCRICGCYVEMRAAMKVRSCPQTPDHWKH